MSSPKPQISMIAVVFAMIIGGNIAVDIHLASMPAIQLYMHTDPQHMQQSVSFFLVGMGVSLLFYGPLSDRYGRRPVVIAGLGLASLSAFATIFVSHIAIFLLLRVLQGVGSAVCAGIGRTILADRSEGRRLAALMSLAGLAVCLSPLMAPLIGAYLQHWFSWRANFFALGCYMGLVLILFVLFVPETNQHRNEYATKWRVLSGNYWYLLRHRGFLGASLLSGIGLAAAMSYAATSAFILQRHYHLSPVAYGWVTFIVSFGGVFGRILTVRLIHYWGIERSIQVAQYTLVVSGVWLLVLVLMRWINVPLFLVGILLVTFAQAMNQGNCSALALGPFAQRRGAAGALYGSCQTLTAFLVAIIVGGVVHNIGSLGLTYLLLGILGVTVFHQILCKKSMNA